MNLCIETASFRQLAGIGDQEMLNCVRDMESDMLSLDGFLSRTVCKDGDKWVFVNRWLDREDIIKAKEKMKTKDSFLRFISSIDMSTVEIKILDVFDECFKNRR